MKDTMNADREHVADMLRRFVDGTIGEWEFDLFLSSKTGDPILEQYRKELAAIPNIYPPDSPSNYASNLGICRILEIANILDSKE
jgi:hypothetical protein